MVQHINIPVWVLLGATIYSLLLLALGWYAYRKLELTMEDYMVASRRVGIGFVAITLVASWMSAFLFVGAPGTVTFNGLGFAGVFIFYIFVFTVLVWVIGTRIWTLGERYGHITPGDLMGDMFNDNRLRIVVSGLLFFWMFVYTLAQFVGAATVFEVVTDGLITFEQGMIWIGIVVGIYIALGGMRGTVLTDLVQAVFFLTVVFGLFFFIAHTLTPGGLGNVFRQIYESNPEILTYQYNGVEWTSQMFISYSIFGAVGLFITPFIFQRFYLADSIQNLKRSVVLYSFGWLIWIPTIALGLVAIFELQGVTNPDTIAPQLALGAGAVSAIVYSIAALAASMSTSDSLTFALGSIAARDIYQNILHPDAEEKTVTKYSQYFMLAVVIGLVIAGLIPQFRANVVPLAVLAIAGWSQIGFPIIAALLWSRASGVGVIAGMLVGTAMLVILFWGLNMPHIYGFHSSIWAGVLNLLVFGIVSVIVDEEPDDRKYEYYYRMNERLKQ